jgi:dolichol-phosphate mannosyltransferase
VKSVTIIIPCYNEEESIPQLFSHLTQLQNSLQNYESHFIFVDDGSKDRTREELTKNLHKLNNTVIIPHSVNKNLGAALKTGISNAPKCNYLAFLDSDCTYDPSILLTLLEKADNGADIVTVSPYHPQGQVEGVPRWRIFLSKGLSFLYRVMVSNKVFTFTAMVRVIRYDKIANIVTSSNDFSFVAECLINGLRKNYKVVEVPCVLKVRKFGVSKMNLLKTIKAHLRIIKKILLKAEL